MTRLRSLRLFIALILGALVLAFPLRGARAQSLPDSLRIVVLGSSTAAGEGTSTIDSAWVWRYAAALRAERPGWVGVNLAKSGYTTAHVLPNGSVPPEGRPLPDTLRNITRAIALNPDAIILNMPSNDAAWNFEVIEQMANFETIAAEAGAAGVPLWVTSTQPRNLTEAQRLNLITMRDWILATFSPRALDFWTELAQEQGMIEGWANSGDGIHLSDAAHALLAQRVINARIPEEVRRLSATDRRITTPLPLVALYPQPGNERVTVEVRDGGVGSLRFLVYDLLGRRVRHVERLAGHSGATVFTLPLDRFTPGSYPWVLFSSGPTVSGVLHVR
jgi:lysophospholipase L1-like esterase